MSDEENDFETEIEAFMNQPVDGGMHMSTLSAKVASDPPEQKTLRVNIPIPEFDYHKAKKKMDSIFKVRGNQKHEAYKRTDDDDSMSDDGIKRPGSAKGSRNGSETSSFKTDQPESGDDSEYKGNKQNL